MRRAGDRESERVGLAAEPEPARAAPTPPDERLAHLVLKSDWPVALCGARVSERFGAAAPGRDRCAACLRIARERALGRPGWV